jgi:penicillin-binding protein 2
MSPDTPRIRLSVLGVVALSLFAALFARLWYLQIMVAPEARVAAEANIVRTVAVEAPRGRILDRHGKVLVDNRISVVVTIDRVKLKELSSRERASVLSRLSSELTKAGQPTTVKDIQKRIGDQRFSPYTPVPVAQDVPEDLKIFLEERAPDFPSLSVERTAVRRYPYGPIGANVLGYVGKITGQELAQRKAEKVKPYELSDEIGKAGIEASFEPVLRGVPGKRVIEVDASGDPVRVIEERSREAIPGDDVVLALDIDVQALTEQTLARGLDQARHRPVRTGEKNKGTVGSAVVEDPSTGELLAMASYPAYPDPSEFVNGISTERWAQLNDPANHYPLNNWAIQGQYAPGSTFKLFTGYAALTSGVRKPNTTLNDTGAYEIPGCDPQVGGCIKRNAGGRKYGLVDMRRALTVSSDFFFYDVGAQFWVRQDQLGGKTAMQDKVKLFGLDVKSGIDLPSERRGRIPTPEWRKGFCENVKCVDDRWFTGDNVNMAIGQGEVLVTPLQLANGYGTFANGGTLRTPAVAREIRKGGSNTVLRKVRASVVRRVDLTPDDRQALLDGLVGVTSREGGTAYAVFQGFPHANYPIAAKTGTAQVHGKADTAVFVAFGPAPAPKFVVSVFMEESGFGGVAAAPVARKLFNVFAGVEALPPAPTGGKYDPNLAANLSPDPQSGGEILD